MIRNFQREILAEVRHIRLGRKLLVEIREMPNGQIGPAVEHIDKHDDYSDEATDKPDAHNL